MKKIAFIITMVVLTGGLVSGQTYDAGLSTSASMHSYYTFSWNTTFPLGDFGKWVDVPSCAGFDIGGTYFIMNGLAAGFNISWQRVGHAYDNQTFYVPEKGIAITATNYRMTWMVPFQGVIAYHFIPDKLVSPYVGLGIGGDYMEHHLMIQEYDIYETQWDFSLTPEVGALVKFGKFSNWGGLVAFNYKWTTNKIEFYNDKTKNLSMLDLKVGLVYLVR
jgi:hypothetical protein